MSLKIDAKSVSKVNACNIKSTPVETVNKITDLLKAIKSCPQIIGRKSYLKHLQGKKITRDEAIAAECYACMGYYRDGREDCKNYTCPLYPFSPSRLYSRSEPLKTKEDGREDK